MLFYILPVVIAIVVLIICGFLGFLGVIIAPIVINGAVMFFSYKQTGFLLDPLIFALAIAPGSYLCGYYWLHAKKDGSRDGRYSYNPRLETRSNKAALTTFIVGIIMIIVFAAKFPHLVNMQ